jgi:hypothetical protein
MLSNMSSDAIPTEVIHHQYGWHQRNDKANWQHSNKETSDTQHSIDILGELSKCLIRRWLCTYQSVAKYKTLLGI